MRSEPQAVVRSTLPEAEAELSALVRARLRGAQRRREEDTAVTGTTPMNLGRSVSFPHRR